MSSLPPTLVEFYRHGPGAEVWEALSRRTATIDVVSNRILLPSHGAGSDDPITLAPGPSLTTSDLPTGLSQFVTYYARVVSSSLLELAAAPGGPAVDFGPGEGTYGLALQFDMSPALTQALAWATAKFLACAAGNNWIEPLAGWGGDVKDVLCDLVAWPQLDRRGYEATKNDGYKERYLLAVETMKSYCAGALVPVGVNPPGDEGAAEPAMGFGTSSWGEETRGWNGRTPAEPWRRAVVS